MTIVPGEVGADDHVADLCCRRQWPEPVFTPFRHPGGFICVARVNNREYQCDTSHESASLAREDAAMQAYWRCQNFSRNDGKLSKEHGRGGQKVQGRPIAIGTERTSTYSDDSRSSGSRSGGSSPTSIGSFASYGSSSRRPIGSSGSSSSSHSRSSRHHHSSRRY